jgi:hypothetical protein
MNMVRAEVFSTGPVRLAAATAALKTPWTVVFAA